MNEPNAAYACATCGEWIGRGQGCEECSEFAQVSGWAQEVADLDDRNRWRWPEERRRAQIAREALHEIATVDEQRQDDPLYTCEVARKALARIGDDK